VNGRHARTMPETTAATIAIQATRAALTPAPPPPPPPPPGTLPWTAFMPLAYRNAPPPAAPHTGICPAAEHFATLGYVPLPTALPSAPWGGTFSTPPRISHGQSATNGTDYATYSVRTTDADSRPFSVLGADCPPTHTPALRTWHGTARTRDVPYFVRGCNRHRIPPYTSAHPAPSPTHLPRSTTTHYKALRQDVYASRLLQTSAFYSIFVATATCTRATPHISHRAFITRFCRLCQDAPFWLPPEQRAWFPARETLCCFPRLTRLHTFACLSDAL